MIWNYKPWWCQPWSIILTGIFIITGSWLSFHSLIVTGIISVLIIAWWSYFLVLYPVLMEKILTETEETQNIENLS